MLPFPAYRTKLTVTAGPALKLRTSTRAPPTAIASSPTKIKILVRVRMEPQGVF
ncbi:MAG TPA: hypothetical protein VNH84_00715 [Candidatus Saccharimonadales bacterium]|nr:hypothetical protein [Candidatus Saccharimonadales bacterium]